MVGYKARRMTLTPDAANDRLSPAIRSLRVLTLCYEWPPAGGGGGRVAQEIAIRLAKRGHQIRVLTSFVPGLEKETVIGNVSVRRAFAGRRRLDRCSVPEMLAYVLAHPAPALAEIRRFKPDAVHVHFAVPTGPVAWFATRFLRVPYLLTAHLGDVPGGTPEQTDHLFKAVKPLTRPIWRSAAGITAVSSFVADLARAAYGVEARVIHNGIDMSRMAQRDDKPHGDALRVIWAGRMQKQKNLKAGLADLALIKDLRWTLDLVGDGPERHDLEQYSTSAGIADRVSFHGWRAPDEIETLMEKADVLFLPSLSEGLSLVTTEALRAGLAFVASRIPGVADVIDDGINGVLCDPRQPGSFASGLKTLIEQPELCARMQRASLARAPQFDAERMADHYEAELLRICGASG